MSVETASAADAAALPAFRSLGVVAAAGALFAFAPATAADAVLTLSRSLPAAEVVELSLDDLTELRQVTIVTENVFVNGKVAFRGPLVRDVIDHLGFDEAALFRFTAANDYSIEIPVSDFRDYDAILALEADGARLSRRERGPLWLMYPISDNEELKDPIYIHRLIRQVVRIEAL